MTYEVTRLNRVPSPDGMRRAVPDTSDQADKPQILVIDQDPHPVPASVMAVLVRDEPGQPFHRELVEIVKHRRRIAPPEVTTPSDQEPIQVHHQVIDGQQQPSPGGVGPDAVLKPSDRTVRRPSTQKIPALTGKALHPAVMETQEIEARRTVALSDGMIMWQE